MAIYDINDFGRRLADELAGMYGDDYRALREDMSKPSGGRVLQKGRSICLSIILKSFNSWVVKADVVRTFLQWTADGIPKEKRDLAVLGERRGYEERLADNLAGLYGGDYDALKSDMAKVRIADRVDAKDYPEERGICLALVLDALEHSSAKRYDVVRSLKKIASEKEYELRDG